MLLEKMIDNIYELFLIVTTLSIGLMISVMAIWWSVWVLGDLFTRKRSPCGLVCSRHSNPSHVYYCGKCIGYFVGYV